MLSSVTKSADALKGPTEWQTLWDEVEEQTAHEIHARTTPKLLNYDLRVGKAQAEKERREAHERECMVRQQRINFYISPPARNLRARKSNMTTLERKKIMARLTASGTHRKPRHKSPTNLGFLLRDGGESFASPNGKKPAPSEKCTPKSKTTLSPLGTGGKSRQRKTSQFEGLGTSEFYREDWTPAVPYRPAHHKEGWKNNNDFPPNTRTLELRKLNPDTHIEAYGSNFASAAALYDQKAYVRPADNKGGDGGTLQRWKSTLREDFATDQDNYGNLAHDQFLDELRQQLGTLTHTSPKFEDVYSGDAKLSA